MVFVMFIVRVSSEDINYPVPNRTADYTTSRASGNQVNT